jgi:YHS domain-containing protein
VDGNRVILKGYDAVAFFEQGKPVKGNPTIKSSYQGATYLFASEADKTAFDKELEKLSKTVSFASVVRDRDCGVFEVLGQALSFWLSASRRRSPVHHQRNYPSRRFSNHSQSLGRRSFLHSFGQY